MSEFIQLHLLTNYAPSNLNRDDLGRPKTAKMGGVDRLRISSQSLKRAWRTSDLFGEVLGGNTYEVFNDNIKRNEFIGVRSKLYGDEWIKNALIENGIDEEISKEWSIDFLDAIGKADTEKKEKVNKLSQLVHLSAIEIKGLVDSINDLSNELKEINSSENWNEIVELKKQKDKASGDKKTKLSTQLQKKITSTIFKSGETSVDIALFGRMLASSPKYNVEAAAQVAHAITVNRIVVEDDYFTAVDDLNNNEEDAGSAHIGESGFGSGVFYAYICINKTLLVKNLGNEELANKAIQALTEVSATVAPSGKQNSYASRARALFLLAEKGSQQPRQLSSAFLKPVDSIDMSNVAIERLEILRVNMDKIYGACADEFKVFNVEKGEGSLAEILAFVGE